MQQTTTYQRALAQARKLQLDVRQINNSLMFDVDSTSQLDAFHHVYLGPNKNNPFFQSTCDCSGPKWACCCHKMSAFLFNLSRLEERLWKGCDVITEMEESQKDSNEALRQWFDLLDRYERSSDLLKAVELGWNISEITGPIKTRLDALKTPDKELQLISA